MTIKRVGIVGSGIMGSGIAEVAAKAGHRGRAAQPGAEHRRRDGRRAREVARQAGRAGQARRRRARRRARHACARSPTSASSPTATSCSSRSSRTSPRRSTSSPSSTASAPSTRSSRPTRRRCPSIELAMETGRPDRVCGVHFFNPAPMMALVEVVRAITSSDETIADATAFATTCGKNPVQVKDQAGLHRERAAVPVPQQRGEAVRRRRRHPRRHRRRDEGRLQLPDGPARAARPRRARHEPGDPRGALRRVQGPELRARRRSCAGWSRPSAWAGRSRVGFYDYRK